MADSAPVLLWMSGTDGGCEFFNQTWLSFTGRTLEQEHGYGWAGGVHPEDLQACVDTYMAAFVERRSFRMEYRLRRADGEFRWLLDQGVPRFAPDQRFEGYIGSCIDIHDLKIAEQTLSQVNAELSRRSTALARSNAELEQFAYVASHDLQEPLRMVASYMQLLQERYLGQLDAEADTFIYFAVDGAKRMQDLVRGLLTYARLGQGEAGVALACNDVVADACWNLRQRLDEAGVELRVGPLPTLHGERAQLLQVFQNLIENAIKFRSEQPPRIDISAQRAGAEWVFCVQDNGIGIEPEHHERIFRVFQRLHGREAYPGNGIGLAICKKIIENHGGRIWLQSELRHGSSFFFTLPAK